jgi:N-acyl homoserine lactone hydrolase
MTTPDEAIERAADATTPPTARVRLIRTGVTRLPPGYVFRGEARNSLQAIGVGVPSGAMLLAPLGAALIDHPTAGPVLVDTGMHPVMATDPKKHLGKVGAAVFKNLRMGPDENAPAQLRAWGIQPEDVQVVIMTHLHVDHTSGMSEFPNATVVVTEAEWKAFNSWGGRAKGYLRRHLPPEPSLHLVDFEAGEAWDGLERTVDFFGDGTVRLVSTPGHTVGHLSVLVQTRQGPVFLLGDAVYTLRNLQEDLLPWRTADDEASERSMRQLRAYARAHPHVPLIPTHDAEVWSRQPARS